MMEYLEGETLAVRLNKGVQPLDQTLRYAIEIASALDEISSHSCFQFRQAKPTTRNNSLASKGFCSTSKPPRISNSTQRRSSASHVATTRRGRRTSRAR